MKLAFTIGEFGEWKQSQFSTSQIHLVLVLDKLGVDFQKHRLSIIISIENGNETFKI